MNREEAIDLLDNLIGMVEDNHQSDYDTALQMAIKALKQEPCDNAVSRQDVLDLAKKGVLVSNGNYESVCKAINELPSVNPQPCEDAISRAEAIRIASGYCHPANVAKELAKLPSVNPTKTGHWIQTNEFFINQDGQFIYKFICSECKSLSYFRKSNKKAIGANVCPNCGAKMSES